MSVARTADTVSSLKSAVRVLRTSKPDDNPDDITKAVS